MQKNMLRALAGNAMQAKEFARYGTPINRWKWVSNI